MKRRRAVEWAKNAAILLLSCSAVYLLTLTPLVRNSSVASLLDRLPSAADAVPSAAVSLSEAARPSAVAVTTSAGRYGAQYDPTATDAAFENFSSLLGRALSSAKSPVSCSDEAFQKALAAPGVCFSFPGSVPLSALSVWLQYGQSSSVPDGGACRLLLSSGEDDSVTLYYQDGESGALYSCVTPLSAEKDLKALLSSFVPNGAYFAFEDDSLSSLAPYTLITDLPTPAVCSVALPVVPTDASACLSVLGDLAFPSGTGSYTGSDGLVYRDGDDSLRISGAGVLTFRSGGTGQARYSLSSSGSPTLAQQIDLARELAQDALSTRSGEAQLYLVSASADGDNATVTFGYQIGGITVATGEGGWCAQFVFSGSDVASFTLYLRSYASAGSVSSVLPVPQAAAALGALSKTPEELTLCYRDTGEDTIAAGWCAKSRQ